jgi:hypothetical protein
MNLIWRKCPSAGFSQNLGNVVIKNANINISIPTQRSKNAPGTVEDFASTVIFDAVSDDRTEL